MVADIPRLKSNPAPDHGKPKEAFTEFDNPTLRWSRHVLAIGQMRLPSSRLDMATNSFSAATPCHWTC